MHIFFITTSLQERDGWSTYTRTLIHGLSHSAEITIFTPSFHPLQYLRRPFITLRESWRCRTLLCSTRPTYIHITAEPYLLLLLVLPRKLWERTILTVHGSYGVRMFQGTWMSLLYRYILRRIGRIIVVSHYSRDRFLEASSYDRSLLQDRTAVVHNGIVLPHMDIIPTSRERIILHVGGVKWRKGVTETIAGLAAYRDRKHEPFTCYIIGSAPSDSIYVHRVQQLIRQLDLGSSVQLLGRISDEELHLLYHCSSVLVMPARSSKDTFEGFGLVYLEANAHGLPVIASTEGGVSEAIDDSRTGYIVSPTDPEKIADAIESILDHHSISSECCRTWASKKNATKMAQDTLGIYKSF